MKDFFRSSRFKVLALLLVLMFGFMIRAAFDSSSSSILAQGVGILLTPVQRVASNAVDGIKGALSPFFEAPRLKQENEELKQQLAQLREYLVDYENYKTENEQLKEYLDLKDKNPDFDFEPATVIGRSASDRFYSFTIDKGSSDGVAQNDPVITSEGLVGIVSEVNITYSKVTTILDATVEVGVKNLVTRDIGVTAGTVELAAEGRLRLSYIPRDSQMEEGQLIVTTGIGGIYPSDLVVGSIVEIGHDSQGLSMYAVIEPVLDIRDVHDVLVITHFNGQNDEDS